MITIDWDQKLYMLSFIQTFNRYGPWMDTNLVLPLGPRRCQVVFDYFLEASLKVCKCHVPSKPAVRTDRRHS
ncbi:hypothetical protein RGQ29_025954 [Quercus rubra]|uniref:Uncharacterized protein n=1 Tax=Quercus rubra TaxID=3512 RepID=A0AAN7EZ87_QUERU|nr:hypothetical protein RGQ29_025954 [Quercus rubra]KAK4582996.1 hypothetical protein RGQ29_025954 [Quercus rubra]